MQKKIIALAIASALTVPAAAMADTGGNVSLYGVADLSVDVVNDGAAASQSTNNLVSNASRVGIKGSEDLGGGLTAMFQVEKEIDLDTGNAHTQTDLAGQATFDRNTYVGLSSAELGTLIAGRHDTPYKLSTRGLDLFADSDAADNRKHIMGGHDTRLTNVIAYMSPSMSGFSLAAASAFGAEGAKSGDTKGTVFSLAGMYSMNGIFGTLAYQSLKFGNGTQGKLGTVANYAKDDEIKAVKGGAGYTMDAFTVNGVVEKTTETINGGAETTGTNWYLGGKYAVSGTDAVKLAYGQRGETDSTGTGGTGKGKDKVKQVSLGYDHDMSKRTTVYALYTKVTDDKVVATVGNPDPSTVSVGIKHAF